MRRRRVIGVIGVAVFPSVFLGWASCYGPGSSPPILTAEMPLHLEEHLDAATIVGSEVPDDLPETVEWRFDEPQPGWKPLASLIESAEPVRVERTEDALRLVLTEADRPRPKYPLFGFVYVDLPGWRPGDWGHVEVRARTSDDLNGLSFNFNVRKELHSGGRIFPVRYRGEWGGAISDGSAHTYRLRTDSVYEVENDLEDVEEGLWQQLIVMFSAWQPATVDLLSVKVIPKEAAYATAAVGVRSELRDNKYRRVLYTHAPARLQYSVRVPDGGRLDVGLGVLRGDAPVTFRIAAQPAGGEADVLLDETYADPKRWAQRTVDLSHLVGQAVILALEAESDRVGTVALWAAPTLSSSRPASKPNVILYVIDAAGADYMSVYGYNRRTTPHLERLAAEGAVFEHAYSNSSWTVPSTPSFLTSLQHSALGGMVNGRNPPPEGVLTMAQHFHRAGYQTAAFTSNPNAGTMSKLERGTDLFREAYVEHHSASSVELHDDFWSWRDAYPAEPYWVHFQTTDVHAPYEPVAPFSGLFINPERRQAYYAWVSELLTAGGSYRDPHSPSFEDTGIDRLEYFSAARDLYDETMAHQDYQIGRLVERLKATGEWEHTLLVVASDHGQPGAGPDVGIGTLDALPPVWSKPMLRSSTTRIPMIFVWPERISPGQRFSDPVSMIDVLPTILDLASLPMPEVVQGQSLAPLLLSEPGWEPRPVILGVCRT